MKPRNLRVLHLDDQRDDVERPIGQEPSTLTGLPRTIEPYVIRDASGSVSAIKGWRTAQRVWKGMGANPPPDLVISDVLFEEDPDSPLSRIPGFPGHEHPIPTGLGHVKPFAAIARAIERPIGIALHTRNANIWATAWEAGHPMGALAAHEIGELAAILGDELCGTTIDESVDRCWAWLRARSRDFFDPALFIAMSHYRQRLVEATRMYGIPGQESRPRVLVLPRDWAELVNWAVARAADAAAPIDAERSLSFILPNGERDCIRLTSLFGEVEGIDRQGLPGRCFQTEEKGHLAPWELDDGGKPQIGRFLMALGSVARPYHQAVELIKKFPLPCEDRPTQTILEAAEELPADPLILGLATLFQVLRWENAKYLGWQEGLEIESWVPGDLMLSEEPTGCSLAGLLKRLAGFVRTYTEPFVREDVLEDQPDLFPEARKNSPWVTWHFDRLVEAGAIRQSSTGTYEVVKGRRLRLEQLAALEPLPAGFPASDLGALRSTVRHSLGFGEENFNALALRLAPAFCNTKDAKAGNLFLDRLLEGQGPPWLLELLREYATEELEWTEERTWPRWLRKPE